MRSTLLVAGVLLLGCGQTSSEDTPGDASVDETTGETSLSDASETSVDSALANPLGHGCPLGTECGPGFVCAKDKMPTPGVCVKPCKVDADCGPGAFCGEEPLPTVGRACFRRCNSTADCEPGTTCRGVMIRPPGVEEQFSMCLPTTETAKEGEACATAWECASNQVCTGSKCVASCARSPCPGGRVCDPTTSLCAL